MLVRLLVLGALLLAPVASATGPIDPDRVTSIVEDVRPILPDLSGQHEILGMVCIDPESNPPMAPGRCVGRICEGDSAQRDGTDVDLPIVC